MAIRLADYFVQNTPTFASTFGAGQEIAMRNLDAQMKQREEQRLLEDRARKLLALTKASSAGALYGQDQNLERLGANLLQAGDVSSGISAITQARMERADKAKQDALLNKDKLDKIDLELGRVFAGINDPESWAKAKATWSTTGAVIPDFEDPTRMAWVESKKAKEKSDKPIIGSFKELAEVASSKYNDSPEVYRAWYSTLSPEQQGVLPNPSSANVETALETASGVVKRGKVLGSEVTSSANQAVTSGNQAVISGTQAQQASITSDLLNPDQNKLYNVVPDALKDTYKTVEDRYEKQYERYSEQEGQVGKIDALLQSAKKKDGNYDSLGGSRAIATVFSFMKALDPRSVVRESEFDLASRAGGWLSKLYDYSNQVNSGITLSPNAVKDFAETVKIFKNAMEDHKDDLDLDVSTTLVDSKLNPKLLLGSRRWGQIKDNVISKPSITMPPKSRTQLKHENK